MTARSGAEIFRKAWIDGVNRHFPGAPKSAYVAPWDETPDWERDSAGAVYEQVKSFVLASGGKTRLLSSEQRGRFVAICWIGQIYRHFDSPKPAYVADWDEMPDWQKQTDAHIFDVVEASVFEAEPASSVLNG
jgi:hypothetical protein